jgi:hypothetical protein
MMSSLLLRGGRAVRSGVAQPEQLDVLIGNGGGIERIAPSIDPAPGATEIQLAGKLVAPSLVDAHQHLDKTRTRLAIANPEGTLYGAIAALRKYAAGMSVADIAARAGRTLAVALPRRVGGERAVAGVASVSVLRHAPALRAAAAFGGSVGVLLAAVALAPLVLAASVGVTVAEAARLTALVALPGIFGRFASGWLLDRGLVPFSVVGAMSLLGVLGLLVALLGSVPLGLALACFAVFQICIGALPGVLSAMLPAVSPSPSQLGAVSRMNMQMVMVGNMLGPPLALSVYAASGAGPATWLLVGVIALSVALIGNLTVFRAAVQAPH